MLEAAAAVTDGHPFVVGLAIVASAAVFGREGVYYAFRNYSGGVSHDKPLCVVPPSVQNYSQASQAR